MAVCIYSCTFYRGHLLGAQDVGAGQAGSDPCGLSRERWRVAREQGFPMEGRPRAGPRGAAARPRLPGPRAGAPSCPRAGAWLYAPRVPSALLASRRPSRWLGQCWLSGALASGQAGSGMIWATCRRLQGPTGGIHPQRAGSQRVPRPVGACGGRGWPGTGWALSRPSMVIPSRSPVKFSEQ